MLRVTRAIVLRMVKYGERSVVLNTYTEQFGARAYMLRPPGRGTPLALGPLDRVELVVREDHRRELQQVREHRLYGLWQHLAAPPERGLVLLFVQEVLCKTLKEEASDPPLFQFIQEALEELDRTEDLPHYPLLFLARLSACLGIFPAPPEQGDDRFDLREGRFFHGACPHGEFLGPEVSGDLARLLTAVAERAHFKVGPGQRSGLLDALLHHYRHHIPGFGQLRSPAVLHALMG
jgi:DNA repair protein RecO (recombination protein O)